MNQEETNPTHTPSTESGQKDQITESEPGQEISSPDSKGSSDGEAQRLPVDLPAFSGPLDLLVHLISKHEMDIFNISISAITQEYLNVINAHKEQDLDLAGEYLVLAASLIRYKVRALLPKEEQEPEEEEIDDALLEARRQEYDRFRQLAEDLRVREQESASFVPRVGPSPEGPRDVVEYEEVSVYDLYHTFQKIIEEIGTLHPQTIAGETYSVDEKMIEIEALLQHNERIVLTDYLRALESKLEMIVVFMALLELIRLREVIATQDRNHAEIMLVKGEAAPAVYDEMASKNEDAASPETHSKTAKDN